MDKDASISLYSKGKNAWNAWARHHLSKKPKPSDERMRAWLAEAEANFAQHSFQHDAEFSGFHFPGRANFENAGFIGAATFDQATFEEGTEFSRAVFKRGASFSGATFKGEAKFREAIFQHNAWFGYTTFQSDTDFGETTFMGDAGFQKATFTGQARFREATFKGGALFFKTTFERIVRLYEATFKGEAMFREATFKRDAGFHKAAFEHEASLQRAMFWGDAGFSEATFQRGAEFSKANFKGDARFEQVAFKKASLFDDVVFDKEANFHAIQGASAFSLADATFRTVPDFIQAHFEEAPRLDNTYIETQDSWPPTLANIKKWFVGDPDLAARWRGLKRLAIQGHDHTQELVFFKGEVTARRGSIDKPWHALFWFGAFYQWLSDFGRSLMRPLLWWIVITAGFACLYLDRQPTATHAAATPVGACNIGPGKTWEAAFGISIRKGLLILGQDTTTLNRFYACLYGIHNEPVPKMKPGQLPARLVPKIPFEIVMLGIAQNLISAVLIFLFLLAVRNHFRIK